jgi:hypothetical protein
MSRPTLNRFLVLAALLLSAATLAACGGSGAPSRAGFVARADAICRDGKGSFRSIQATAPTTAAQAAAQTGKLVTASEAEVRRLRALTPPDTLRPDFEAYLKSRDDAVDVLRKGQAAAKRNDPGGYATAKQEIAAGQPKRFDLARKVGFEDCSKPEVRASGAGSSKD